MGNLDERSNSFRHDGEWKLEAEQEERSALLVSAASSGIRVNAGGSGRRLMRGSGL